MSGSGADWDAEAGEGPELGLLRVDPERADRLKKSPSAFRTISEVADDLHIPQHVLRFWETRFPQVKPLKRGGGRRYYRPDDIALLRRISELLYIQGYTIKGVQRLLREGDGTLLDVPPPDVADADVVQAQLDPEPGAAAVVEDPDVDEADAAPFLSADAIWGPDVGAPPFAEASGAINPTPDEGAERFRTLLRDVLDELRMLRRQIPD